MKTLDDAPLKIEQPRTVPLDTFGDQPFIYRRTKEGGYRLYSVGDNLKDDAGATFDSEPKGDDILLAVPVPR